MAEMIPTKTFPGKAQAFRIQMQRLFNLHGGKWQSSEGERFEFREWRQMHPDYTTNRYHPAPGEDVTPPERTTWMVWPLVPEINGKIGARRGEAAIEAYQDPGGESVEVRFHDGYSPAQWAGQPPEDKNPIGVAFQEFCFWVIREIWDKVAKPEMGSTSQEIYNLAVSFAELDALIEQYLGGPFRGWVAFTREKVTEGSVIYKMTQYQLGDLGAIKVYVDGEGSKVQIYRPPEPPLRRELTPEETAAANSGRESWSELRRKLRDEQKQLYRERLEHQGKVIEALFNKLSNDFTWIAAERERKQSGVTIGGAVDWDTIRAVNKKLDEIKRELAQETAEPEADDTWIAAQKKASEPTSEDTEEGGGNELGTQGGTLARVKTARELIEQGTPKTQACKKARTDPRTYDRYVTEIIDWERTLPDT